jgi:acyl-[acyl-carrier-protein]-phospholipid O-acyltransferase / long-chain-fatty-acid--[acyl-carrier-protein] ligase
MDKNLFFDRRFWPLFWTQFLGAFNDNVFKNALVILITFKAYTMLGLSPKDMVALASGVFILPFFIFSPIAGQIADKYSKSTLIYWIKIWELLAMALGAIGFYSENLYLLMFTLFFMGLQSTFFGPIKYSVLPELLQPEEMLKGNALVGMGTFISILLGTILGGTLIALGDHAAFAVSAAVIFLALLGILTGKAVPYLAPSDQNLKLDFTPIRPIKTVLQLSRNNSEVHQSIRGISWFWFLGAAVLSIIPPYCHEILKANELIVTYFLALFSIGVGIGSMVCEKICKGDVKLGTVPIGAFGMTLFLFDLFLVGVPELQFQSISQVLNSFTGIRISLDMLLFSICGGFFIIPLYTLMQVKTETAIRSRIVAANNIANAMYMVVASVLLIVFFQSGMSIPQVLGVLAILNILFTSYIFYRRPEFIHEVKSLLRPN